MCGKKRKYEAVGTVEKEKGKDVMRKLDREREKKEDWMKEKEREKNVKEG